MLLVHVRGSECNRCPCDPWPYSIYMEQFVLFPPVKWPAAAAESYLHVKKRFETLPSQWWCAQRNDTENGHFVTIAVKQMGHVEQRRIVVESGWSLQDEQQTRAETFAAWRWSRAEMLRVTCCHPKLFLTGCICPLSFYTFQVLFKRGPRLASQNETLEMPLGLLGHRDLIKGEICSKQNMSHKLTPSFVTASDP